MNVFEHSDPLVRNHVKFPNCNNSYTISFYPWILCVGHLKVFNNRVVIDEERTVVFPYGECIASLIEFLITLYADIIEKKNALPSPLELNCSSVKVEGNFSVAAEPCLKIGKKCITGTYSIYLLHHFNHMSEKKNLILLGQFTTILQFPEAKDIRQLCENLEQLYLCAIWIEVPNQIFAKKFISVFYEKFQTHDIKSFSKMNQEDQSEVIRETSKALHTEPSKEGFFYFMIFTNIDYLADYHTLRDFKPKKGAWIAQYLTTAYILKIR